VRLTLLFHVLVKLEVLAKMII